MNYTTRFLFGAYLALMLTVGLAEESAPATPTTQSVDAEGNTPLHLAVLRGDADAVDALLKAGADAAAINVAGATPLHYATASERMVTALITHGAPVNAVSKLSITPLVAAVMYPDSIAVVRRLVEAGAEIKYPPGSDTSFVLNNAIDGGDRRTVEFLLDHGAEANPVEGGLPIVSAAFAGEIEMVKLLLNHGAKVNCRDLATEWQPLSAALWTNQYDIAQLLIERGADLNARASERDAPPVVLSAYNDARSPIFTRLMVERGVDINSVDINGETALSYALKRGSESPLVAYLREAGAKPSAVPRRTKTVPSRAVPADSAARQAMVRDSVQRAIDLIQPSSKAFLEVPMVHDQQKCISCHQQTLPGVSLGLARERGLRVDEHELGRSLYALASEYKNFAETVRQSKLIFTLTLGFDFDFLNAVHFPANELTEMYSRSLLALQRSDGSWSAPVRRPPMEDGPLVATAWAARALQLYPPIGHEHEATLALNRARNWLAGQKPRDLNDRIFQLLGIAWTNETTEHLRPLAEQVIAAQSPDGGWAQFPSLNGDAWTTGSALVALNKAGFPTAHPSYQRGVAFLLRTQFDDGSWWVRSRAIPTQNHFNGKFPHGKDQWISAAGTSWAMTALLLTLEPTVDPTSLLSANELIAKFEAAPKEKSAKELAASSAEKIQSTTYSGAMDFVRDIKPILERSCVGCHSAEKAKGSLSLASRETLLKGGQSGEPAIIPGYADDSQLMQFVSGQVEDLEMPPLNRRKKYPALSPEELDRLHTWIDAGAPWPASSSIEKEIAPAPTASTEKPASAASPGA